MQAPTQDIPKLPEGTPGWVFAVVYGAIAVISVVAYLGRRSGASNKSDTPPAAADPGTGVLPAARPGPVQEHSDASQALMERLVAGLERRLDKALATTESITARYEAEIDELRTQLSAEQQSNWRLHSQMQDLTRQLEDARNEVVRLRAELNAVRPPSRGSW